MRARNPTSYGGRLHVREEIVLDDAIGAAAQHLGDGGVTPSATNAGRSPRPRSARCAAAADLERQVVGDAAQQRHRVVGVRIHQPGDQRRIRARHRSAASKRARASAMGSTATLTVAHHHGMAFQHHAMRHDRRGGRQQVAGLELRHRPWRHSVIRCICHSTRKRDQSPSTAAAGRIPRLRLGMIDRYAALRARCGSITSPARRTRPNACRP